MSKETVFFVTLLFGWLGVHKFLKGNIKTGLLYLFTFGLFGIGWGIDTLISLTKMINVDNNNQYEAIKNETKTNNSIEFNQKTFRTLQRQETYKKKKTFANKFVVLDFETTGLSPDSEEIIEAGAILYENGQPTLTYSSLVRPSKLINDFIAKHTGITNEMLENAPSSSIVLEELLSFIGGNTIVAHNASFDMNFLFSTIAKSGFEYVVENKVADTLSLSRKYLPYLKDHKLETLKDYLGFKKINSHRALSDCTVTGTLYLKLKEISEQRENEK